MAYPQNTSECILHLFPNAIPERDFSVSKISDGSIEITDWNTELGSEPTDEQLNAVSSDAEVTAKFKYLRKKRNRLLAETDWMSGSDVTMSAEWTTYRQSLRDITNGLTTVADIEAVTWPTKPE